MNNYRTDFGTLTRFTKGRIEVIDDSPKNYAFSNVYEVASKAAAYEKIVVGKNLEYVIEVLRAEGQSAWFAAAHDEFALVMDGTVRIDLLKPDAPLNLPARGSAILDTVPVGRNMGWLELRRGHQALLPAGAAYRFSAPGDPGVVVLQTLAGPCSIEKWAEICLG